MPSFDLLTRPWLPVLDAASLLRHEPEARVAMREIGLREALLRAHEIREVHAGSPLETIALDRFLLALALDVYLRTPDADAWAALWRAGRFPAEPLDAYLAELEGDRFDLFHPERPFYGRATPDASKDGKDPATPSKLFQGRASGNNATLFAHDLDGTPLRMPPAQAARGLVATQAAALGGGVSKPFPLSHAPLVGRAQIWIRGRSLFEALLLNGPPWAEARMGDTGDDAPVWRRPYPDVYSKRRPNGLLDVLTWPSRRVTLLTVGTGDDTVVTGLQFTQGDKTEPLPTDDPLAAHRASKDKGFYPLGLRADRALWRDAATLFATDRPTEASAPATLRWLIGESRGEDALTDDEFASFEPLLRDYGVDVFGLVNDQAKAELWRHERMPAYAPILRDPKRQERLRLALRYADDQYADKKKGLRRAVRTTAEYALSPPPPGDEAFPNADPKAVGALAQSLAAGPRYWAALEPLFFRFLARLAAAADGDAMTAALDTWKTDVFAAAEAAFDAATVSFDGDARRLRATAQGRTRLQQIA